MDSWDFASNLKEGARFLYSQADEAMYDVFQKAGQSKVTAEIVVMANGWDVYLSYVDESGKKVKTRIE